MVGVLVTVGVWVTVAEPMVAVLVAVLVWVGGARRVGVPVLVGESVPVGDPVGVPGRRICIGRGVAASREPLTPRKRSELLAPRKRSELLAACAARMPPGAAVPPDRWVIQVAPGTSRASASRQ